MDSSGYLYVESWSPTPTLYVYAPSATDPAKFTRTISGPLTLLTGGPITVDTLGNIYVANGFGPIVEFAADSGGNATPIRVIDNYIGWGFNSIVVDTSGNLYAATNQPTTQVYSPLYSGNGISTTEIPGIAKGVAVDAAGNIYVTSYTSDLTMLDAIFEYPPANPPAPYGYPAPARSITSSATPNYQGVAVDPVGTIYTVAEGSTTGTPSVQVFSSNATGSAPPIATITSPAWTHCGGCRIAIY